MGKKEPVPNRNYTDEFKAEAVRLALSTGGNAAAKRLGIRQSTMTNWVRRSCDGVPAPGAGEAVPVKRPVSEVGAENARLRRELASAKLDLEIVIEAAAGCAIVAGGTVVAPRARAVTAARRGGLGARS